MVESVHLGIVGAGKIALEHLKVLRSIPDVHVVGITSRTKEKAQILAEQFAIPLATDDLAGLMRTAQPDGLLIVVSADQIYDTSCSALTFGVPLFIEKPAGLSPAETWNLTRSAQEQGVRTMVGYNRRYYSIFHKGLEIVREHGPLMGVMIEGHERIAVFRAGGHYREHIFSAWLYANATHTIDLLRFFGGDVQEVVSRAHRYQEPGGDQFVAVMNFTCGALGTYVSHWLSPGGWRAVLYGRGVTVEFKPLETGRWTDAQFQTYEIEPDPEDQQYKPGFYRQMAAFRDLVRGAPMGWPWQDLAGAYQTMRLAEAIAASVEDRT
jgi:predicted dehydrogenase